MPSGCRRSTARRAATAATTSATTPRSTRCSAARRSSTGSWPRPIGAGSGWSWTSSSTTRAPSTRGSRTRRHRGRAPTPTGTCGATRPGSMPPAGRCRRTTGCRGSAARPGPTSRAAASSTTTRSWRSSRTSIGVGPAVETAQHDVVRAWIARGVDGFRLDTFNVYLKHPDLPSNPTRRGSTAWDRQAHIYDIDQPDLPELLARFRAVVDAAPGRMTVGEMFVGTTEGGGRADDRAASRLRLGALDPALVGDGVRLGHPPPRAGVRPRALADRRPVEPRPAPPRLPPRGDGPGGEDDRDAIAKASAVLSLTMRGTPFLYYGEEIGMGDVAVPAAESVDPAARHVSADFHWWDRSQSRTPMPWTAGPGAGFTTGRPWLRLGPDTRSRNVASQAADEDSVLACYRRLLRARIALPSLQDGAIALVRTGRPDVLAYRRRGSGPEVLTMIAFGRAGATVTVPPRRRRADLASRGRHAPRSSRRDAGPRARPQGLRRRRARIGQALTTRRGPKGGVGATMPLLP